MWPPGSKPDFTDHALAERRRRQHSVSSSEGEVDMIYELRIYHCVPGRLPDLIKRFDTLTLPLWKKHGIQQAGFWTVTIGPSNQDLYYMLKWESLDDRAKRFAGFQADPEWISGRAETEKNGQIVASITNTILQPTGFSSVK
jgi:hypothetical protein